MLEVRNLVVRYENFLAVNDVSVTVAAGEIVGVIGPNGAGKTSVVKAVGGLLTPNAGEIRLNGQALNEVPPEKRVKLGLSVVPEGRGLFPQMSVYENLLMGGYNCPRERIAELLGQCFSLFPVLQLRLEQRAATLSGGQQQMLALSMGLMSSPKLLIVDEPSLGLAPIVMGEIGRNLKSLKAKGIGVLLIEQNATMTCDVADRIYIMQSGNVILEDKPEVLLRNSSIVESFLAVN